MTISYGLFKSRFKKTIADAIYNEITTKTSRYYHFLGKENAWTDFLSPFIPSQDLAVGDVPGAPSDDYRYELHVRRDILTAKLITPADVSYIVPRIDWVSSSIYDMYDDAINPSDPAQSGAIRLEEAQYYVLTSEYNVYKCLDNNYSSKSLYEPTGTSTNTFTTADGYKWKFMYTIPISLRNRFLSSIYMPVTTALKAPFYSNGEIVSFTIENGGSGYSSPELIVSGDGFIENNPYIIQSITTSTDVSIGGNPGIGYTIAPPLVFANPTITLGAEQTATALCTVSSGAINSLTLITSGYGYNADPNPPTITVPPPVLLGVVSNSAPWAASTVVSLGDSTKNTSSGSSSSFIATITTSTAHGFSTGDIIEIAGVTPSGYNRTAAVIVTSTTQFKYLTASANIGNITTQGTAKKTSYLSVDGRYYKVTTAGTTGTTAPTHTSGAASNGTASLTYTGKLSQFVISTTVALNNYLSYDGRYYQVTTAGTTGTTNPTHTTGVVANGTAQLTYVGTQAIVKPVMVKTEADLDAILGPGGEIIGVTINDGGIGYTNANIQIVDSTGAGGVIEANFNPGNVDTLQANVELLAVTGTIDSMIVVDGGAGYGAATVEVRGDGTGCVATANVSGGKVVSIDIVTPGYGYTWTDIVIGGNGTGAVVRAIMSPIGGHGSNAIDELNANSIMFYSSFARDINQGLNVTNDYRKAGLLRNIKQFGSDNRFNQDIGSGCVLITGTFDKTKLEYDQLLVQSDATYKQYRIVEFNDTQILISVFNNFTIVPGDILVTPEGYTILVSDVKERTIDQFSGDFLFLTVRESFAPSEEQIITIRTVLTI